MLRLTCRRMASLLDHARRSAVALVLTSVLAGLSEGAAILVVVRVAVDLASDRVSTNFVPLVAAPTSPLVALLIAGGLAAATLVSHYFIARLSAEAAAQVLGNARSRALRAFSGASWAVQSRQRLGALQETVSTLSLLSSTVAQVLATGIANSVMLIVFLAIAVAVNPFGTLFIALAGVAIFAIIRPLTGRNQVASREFTLADTRFSEETTNFAVGSMELRAYGVTRAAEERLESDLDGVVEGQRLVRFRTAFATTLYRDIAVLLIVASLGVLTLFDRNAVGSASAVVVLAVRALASAQAMNSMLQQVGERGPTVELLLERIGELEAARQTSGTTPVEAVEVLSGSELGYAYPDGPNVLEGISFELARGESVGIAGPSGSGKSTLLQLVLRLRRPSSGRLTVNGVDVWSVADADWARLVAYVPQEPMLFEGTIRDNIAFYRDIPEERIIAAAREAHVADEILRLPSGFDTVLGPLGSGLSGGQKQRVAIARALAGDPDVLVLDEPSSALDGSSEARFRETVRDLTSRDRIVLLVAHRPETLAVCSRVLEMDGGRLSAVPRHEVADQNSGPSDHHG